MGLLENARVRGKRHAGPKCSVAKALAEHPKLAVEIVDCLKDHTVPQVAVEEEFVDAGIDISGNTIGRHRANQCLTCRQAGMSF